MTELNQKILEMLRSSEGHLTADEAFFLAKKKKINVSLASIYRILTNLSDQNLIKRISVPGHNDVFDKTNTEHGHFVCLKCGKVKDIEIKNIKEFLERNIKEDFKSFNLSINYVCDECKKGDA